jgi:hypothetical protein
MERGQGWQKITDAEFDEGVQLDHFHFSFRDQVIRYEQPYQGDYVSVAQAASIVDLFDDASEVMFAKSTDDPNTFSFHWLMINEWRMWSAHHDGEIIRITVVRKSGPSHSIYIVMDDWFLVDVDDSGYYRCDQMQGLANLIRDMNEK